MDETVFSIDPTNVVQAVAQFERRGPHPEYQVLEQRLGYGARRRNTTYWRFIEDAVEGTGGFSNGIYLNPYRLEYDGTGRPSRKLLERVEMADYDNFPRDIIMAPWDSIVQSKDMIVRKSSDPRIENWWRNVDGNGQDIMTFNESVQKQAQMYGNGYVIVDRDSTELKNQYDDQNDNNLPYCTKIPSENIVDWSFGEDGELFSVTIFEPTQDETWVKATDNQGMGPHNLKIWTKNEWAVFRGSQKAVTDKAGKTSLAVTYTLMDMGANLLGEVPLVSLNYSDPGPKTLLAKSSGIEIARIAQTVYNMDSEYREIERKCALFLAMPVKNVENFDDKKAVAGRDNLLVYDGDAGKPEWVTPDLSTLDKYASHRERLIESAYAMAHLRSLSVTRGITGSAKSGFQSEVEFAKTERRIAAFAVQLEAYEIKLTRLFAKYMGIDPDAEAESTEAALIDIQYPREFGVHDVEKAMNRSNVLLAMNLGDDSNRLALYEMFKVLYPRLPNDKMDAMIEGSVASLRMAAQQAQAAALGGAAGSMGAPGNLPPGGVPTPPGSPSSNPRAPGNSSGPVPKTASQRIQELLTRDVARDTTRGMRNVT